jgi:hypothetical protein
MSTCFLITLHNHIHIKEAEVNECQREVEEVLFSRCSVGKNKWLWTVWLYDKLLGGHPPFAYGYETTSSAAEETARQALRAGFYFHLLVKGMRTLQNNGEGGKQVRKRLSKRALSRQLRRWSFFIVIIPVTTTV